MFAQDRDLLVLEPRLFLEIGFLSQTLGTGTGTLAGGVVTSTGLDFVERGVTVGGVLVFGEVSLEVTEVISPTTARVSLIRGDAASPEIAPADVAAATPISVRTFAPQLAEVGALLLVLAGAGARLGEGVPPASSVTNGESLRRVTSLGALHRIYSAAASLVADDHPYVRKGESYKRAFDAERSSAVVELDLDADGVPEVRRRLSAVRFVRV